MEKATAEKTRQEAMTAHGLMTLSSTMLFFFSLRFSTCFPDLAVAAPILPWVRYRKYYPHQSPRTVVIGAGAGAGWTDVVFFSAPHTARWLGRGDGWGSWVTLAEAPTRGRKTEDGMMARLDEEEGNRDINWDKAKRVLL